MNILIVVMTCLILGLLVMLFFTQKNQSSRKIVTKGINVDPIWKPPPPFLNPTDLTSEALMDVFVTEFDKNWKVLCTEINADPLNAPDSNRPFIVDGTLLDGLQDDKPVFKNAWFNSYINGAFAVTDALALLVPPLALLGYPGKDSCLCCNGNANPFLFADNAGVINNSLTGVSDLLIRNARTKNGKIILSLGTTDTERKINVGVDGKFSIKYKCRKCARVIWLCRDEKEWKTLLYVGATNKDKGMKASITIPKDTELFNITLTPTIKPQGDMPYTINIDKLELNHGLALKLDEDSYYISPDGNANPFNSGASQSLTIALASWLHDVNGDLEGIVKTNVFNALVQPGRNGAGIIKDTISDLLNNLINRTCSEMGIPDEYLQLCEQLGKILSENDRLECTVVFSQLTHGLIQKVFTNIYDPVFNVNENIRKSISGELTKAELCQSNNAVGTAITGICSLLRKRPATCGGGLYMVDIDSVTNLDKLKISEFIVKEATTFLDSTIISFDISIKDPMVVTLTDLYMKFYCDCKDIPFLGCDDSNEFRNWYIGYKQAEVRINYTEPFIRGKFEFTKHGTVVLKELVFNETISPVTQIISTEQMVGESPFDDTPPENDATDKFANNQLIMSLVQTFLMPSVIKTLLSNIIPIVEDEISKIIIDQDLLELVFQCTNDKLKKVGIGKFSNDYTKVGDKGLVCNLGNTITKFYPPGGDGRCRDECNKLPNCAGYSYNDKRMMDNGGKNRCIIQNDNSRVQCTVDTAQRTPLAIGKGFTYYTRDFT